MARCAGHTAARMGSGSAHAEALPGPTTAAVAEYGRRGPQLIQRHVAVQDVATREAEGALQPFRNEHLTAEDRGAKTGRVGIHSIDDRVRRPVLLVVPIAPIG
jgi:hypothetical protein